MSGSLRILGFSTADALGRARLDEFARLEPDVALHVDEAPPDHRGVLAAIADGDVPDVLYLDRDMVGAYAARDALLPLDDWVERDGVDRRQFREGPLRHVTMRGATYGIPEVHDIHVLFVHTPALTGQYILARDVEFGDWVLLPRVNQLLTDREGGVLRRIGVDTGLPELLPIWAKANGADLVSADGRTATFDDPRVVKALEVAKDMIDAQGGWLAVTAFQDELDLFGPDNPIARDQIAVLPMPASYLDVLAEESPYLDIQVKPIVDGHAIPLSYSQGMAWAVPRDAADPEASWRFIRSVSAPDAWVAGARARMDEARAANRKFAPLYTANKVADSAIWTSVFEPTGVHLIDRAYQAVREIQETGYSVPANAAPRELRAAWMSAARRALRGDRRPAEALREANAEAQAALDAAAG